MSLPLLAVAVMAILGLGYTFYGSFVARQYSLDPKAQTPSERHNDGVDFVPTRPFYLLGQHFSAIAAAGPIAGPILACTMFGWLPAILWISVGVVFIGAVHDFSTLIASVRHDGKSIAEVVKANLGPRASLALMAFIWLALVYVIVAFTDVTAATFVSGDADMKGLTFRFNPGGAVAAASVLYLSLSVVMGLVERFLKPKLLLQTLIFVPLTLVCVYAGTRLSTVLILPVRTWGLIILGYCFVASLTPVWALLQPRGYLGGFVLYLALAFGIIGMFFGGFDIHQPAFKGLTAMTKNGPVHMFPFLFVTIACGACSGFHGLVCSGTTSKQIQRETHCKQVGYGAMLLEAFVALIALATVMIAVDTKGKGPGAIYGSGLGAFVSVVLGKDQLLLATTFGAMAFSTFVFDTLDVSTRLGRYILQEVFGWNGKVGALVATALTCGVPALFLLNAGTGSYLKFWTLFGTSNQLLAALSLLGITVWLKKSGKKYWYTLLPMVFVFVITLWALGSQILTALEHTESTISVINAVVAGLLVLLAMTLLAYGIKAMRGEPPLPAPASRAA